MTISSNVRKAGPYTGNNVTTAFPFTFKVFQASDVVCTRLTVSSGSETVLTINTDYTVSLNADQNSNPGGTVNLLAALASTYTLTITSFVDYLQPTDLTNQGGFYPSVITDSLDRSCIQTQQLKDNIDRSLKISVTTPAGVSTQLPAPVANEVIGWDNTGEGLRNWAVSDLVSVTAYGTATADIFTGNGTTTTFTLSFTPANIYNLDVSINGVTQIPNTDYTWTSGTTLTFTSAPPTGLTVLVRYLRALAQGTVDWGSVSSKPFVSSAVAINQTISASALGYTAIEVLDGGSFAVATGCTFTIDVPFRAPLKQVFSGTGAVVFGSGSVSEVYPQWFGVKGDGTATNDSSAMAKAVASVPTYGTLSFPAGAYVGYLSIRKNNITIKGDGSGSTKITMPSGVLNNVLEVGETAWSGSPGAYSKVTISGLTLDGNKSSVPQPTTDLTSWGLPVTNTTYLTLNDIRVYNCWNGGFGIFINSNYGCGDNLYAENCGAGFGSTTEPGFDINSSSNGIWNNIVVYNCKNGIRAIDNCNNISVTGIVKNAIDNGFIAGATSGNTSTGNIYNVSIESGCQYVGASVGGDVRSSIFNLTIRATTAIGFYCVKQASATNNSAGNIFNVTTRNIGNQAAILGGDNNNLNHVSFTDGITGAQGSWYATTISGSYNTVTSKIIDSATWQVRGIATLSGATLNVIAGYTRNDANTGLISDSGTGTRWCLDTYLGSDVASPADGYLILPFDGSAFKITGTNTITQMHPVSAAGRTGKEVVLLFQGVLTVYDANNLKLNGNFVTAAGAVLKLIYDGTNWYETSRVQP